MPVWPIESLGLYPPQSSEKLRPLLREPLIEIRLFRLTEMKLLKDDRRKNLMSLFEFNQHKKALVERVVNQVSEDYSHKSNDLLDQLLEEMIYWEKKRIVRVERSWRQKRKIDYWEDYKKSYLRGTIPERQALLRGSIDFYAN